MNGVSAPKIAFEVTGTTVGQLTSDSVAKGSTVVDEYLVGYALSCELRSSPKSLLAMRVPTWGGRTVPSKSPQELPTTIPQKTVPLWSMR